MKDEDDFLNLTVNGIRFTVAQKTSDGGIRGEVSSENNVKYLDLCTSLV
jgi:hypothetical protein